MANRIINLLNKNGITSDPDTIETIISGNGTKADGTIDDILQTIICYCEITDEVETIINELAII